MTDMMKGVSLDTFAEDLHPLPDELMTDPYCKGDLHAMLPAATIAFLEAAHGKGISGDRVRRLPRSTLEKLSFEDVARMRASSMFSMSSSMEEMFEEDPRFTLFDRIRTSMWHWGCHRPNWNEYVEAYRGLRRFRFDLPDFEARITWTNYACDGSESEHCDTWLDGHFAYLIHYRGVHVMTLGFSLSGPDRLLVQQVQTTSERGNRWLFRIPGNRMEFFVDLFARAFPSHRILVVDGVDLVERNVLGYLKALRKTEARVERLGRRIETDEDRATFNQAVIEHDLLSSRLEALKQDTERLAALYADCGRYRRLQPETINRMTHYPLAA